MTIVTISELKRCWLDVRNPRRCVLISYVLQKYPPTFSLSAMSTNCFDKATAHKCCGRFLNFYPNLSMHLEDFWFLLGNITFR